MSDRLIFPVPIRDDLVAEVHVPHDLTKAEAEKICRVVIALVAIDDDAAPLTPNR